MHNVSNLTISTHNDCGPGSVVGIATGYGLDGLGIESRWERDFPHLSRPALGPIQPPVQWVLGLSRGKDRPGRDAYPSPLLVRWSRNSRAIPLLPLWVIRAVQSLSACTRVHFTFTFKHIDYFPKENSVIGVPNGDVFCEVRVKFCFFICMWIYSFKPLNAKLNPICHLLALLGAHPILHVSRIKVRGL